MEQPKLKHGDYVVQSLVNQISDYARQIAERDAIITEQQIELEQLRKEQIKEMDEGGEEEC